MQAYKMIPPRAARRYPASMRALGLLLAVAACGDSPDAGVFGFVGEVADGTQQGSTIGLFVVSSSPPAYTYKLGDGTTELNEFGISFRSDPPPEALDADGVGVAQIGMLPGLATVPEGVVDRNSIFLDGLSIDTAVIFKTSDATGPAWTAAFPTGFSCGRCVSDTSGGLDTFEPIACDFVVVQASLLTGCIWY